LSGGSWYVNLQHTVGMGVQGVIASQGTLAGPAVGFPSGMSVGYTYSICK
jgi:hypothetical protein